MLMFRSFATTVSAQATFAVGIRLACLLLFSDSHQGMPISCEGSCFGSPAKVKRSPAISMSTGAVHHRLRTGPRQSSRHSSKFLDCSSRRSCSSIDQLLCTIGLGAVCLNLECYRSSRYSKTSRQEPFARSGRYDRGDLRAGSLRS